MATGDVVVDTISPLFTMLTGLLIPALDPRMPLENVRPVASISALFTMLTGLASPLVCTTMPSPAPAVEFAVISPLFSTLTGLPVLPIAVKAAMP
jgi:hypothetical protein